MRNRIPEFGHDVGDLIELLKEPEMESLSFVFVANEYCGLWPTLSTGVRLLESRLFADELHPREFYQDVAQVTPNQADSGVQTIPPDRQNG